MGTLKVIGSALYQWEIGRKIRIDASVGNRAVEVQFAHPGDKEALSVIPKEENGVIVAEVPNIMLQSADKLVAFLVEMDENCVETTRHSVFHVVNRPRPADYIYTETEVLNYTYLDNRLKELEGDGLANAVADYLKDNPVQAGATKEEAAQIQQNKTDIEQLAQDKLDASVLPEAVNEALAEAKASGEFKGDPGDDYILTPADKQEIAELAADMVEVPEGGTVTDEQIASAVEDYMAEHPVTGGNGDQNKIAEVAPVFQTQPIGELYKQPENYTAWGMRSLNYDKNIGKFVDILNGATQHVNNTNTDVYVVEITPGTYKATEPVRCTFLDSDGTTDITADLAATAQGIVAWMILDDGTYMLIRTHNGTMYKFTSSDHGTTWVKGSAVTGLDYSTKEVYYITELSNGRMLCSITAQGIFYSDDEGINWTRVIPTTAGGDYEAEIFLLEMGKGTVLAVGRLNLSGTGYSASGDADHAIISVSKDYGSTWSAWKISETLDNMNAGSAAGYYHDGRVEIFTGSRWYKRGGNSTTDYDNTGKSGAITHYTATAENAVSDKFTKIGIVVYSNAKNGEGNDLAAQDFHTPCVAVNDREMLMSYFDRVSPYTEEKVNHHYVRGMLGSLGYSVVDTEVSKLYAYSSRMVEARLAEEIAAINKRIDAISSGGGGTDTPDEPETDNYTTSGLVCHVDALASDVVTNQKLTDSVSDVTVTAPNAVFTEQGVKQGDSYITISAAVKGLLNNPQEFSVEMCSMGSSGGTVLLKCPVGYTASAQADMLRKGRNMIYYDTADAQAQTFNFSTITWADTSELFDVMIVFSAEAVRYYINGSLIGEKATTDINAEFTGFANYFNASSSFPLKMDLANNTLGDVFFRSLRIYNRALTASEIVGNYNYEAGR